MRKKYNNSFAGTSLKLSVAGRSFGDVSAESVFFNLPLMLGGYVLMFVYTMLTLGKISAVEIRVYLSMVGISSIGRGDTQLFSSLLQKVERSVVDPDQGSSRIRKYLYVRIRIRYYTSDPDQQGDLNNNVDNFYTEFCRYMQL
jgi:hypothetical protein